MTNSVVLITIDCLRMDHVGVYGYRRDTTPNIDQFAENAARFETAYSNAPGTRWAFQTVHGGISAPRLQGLGLPDGYRTLASRFEDAGYATAGFTGNNGFLSKEYGYDQGFDHYFDVFDAERSEHPLIRVGKQLNDWIGHDIVFNLGMPIYNQVLKRQSSTNTSLQHTDSDTIDAATEWLDGVDESFFLWTHLMDAHTPYGYWPDHLRVIRGDDDIDCPVHPGREGLVTEGQDPPQRLIDTYDASIREADEQIGRLLEEVPDAATVIITADHGEEFGRHNPFHKESVFASMSRIPFLFRSPKVNSGTYDSPVQLLDIGPTLLTAADVPIPDAWEGSPLQSVGMIDNRSIFFSLDTDRAGVYHDGWKYIDSEDKTSLKRVDTAVDDRDRATVCQELSNKLTQYCEWVMNNPVDVGARVDLQSDSNLASEVEQNLDNLGYL